MLLHSLNITGRPPASPLLLIYIQLLKFIVSPDAINLLHRDIQMKNMFVVQSHSLELARLAVGDFGAAQRGEERVRNMIQHFDRDLLIRRPFTQISLPYL